MLNETKRRSIVSVEKTAVEGNRHEQRRHGLNMYPRLRNNNNRSREKNRGLALGGRSSSRATGRCDGRKDAGKKQERKTEEHYRRMD